MSTGTRLFIILWLAGMVGVLSILLIDLNALIAITPASNETDLPPMLVLKLLSLIQPTVLLSLAVLVGVGLASKSGLSAPVAEAVASRGDLITALKPQIIPGIVGGLGGGVAIVLITMATKPFLVTEAARISEFTHVMPLPTRLLFGGVTEELLLRWGMMTFLVWLMWRFFQKGEDKPKPVYYVAAILISSFLFAIGHLPIAFLLFAEPKIALMLLIIAANSVFGLVAGYLYWKKGLESAIIAHMITHIVLFTSSYFGAYF